MTQELIYTSAPQGLKPGTRGFCTVACTQGMAPNLIEKLESLSGYRHLYGAAGSRTAVNQIVSQCVQVTVGGRRYYVLSQIRDAGIDYSQRSNKFASHVVLGAEELPSAGPAWLLSQPGFLPKTWSGEPRLLPASKPLPTGQSSPAICRHWAAQTGDAGWGGVLAATVLDERRTQATLIIPLGYDPLPLVAESLALLPERLRWQVAFSTYFTKLPPGVDCHWRFLVDGTPEAAAAARSVQGLLIDLRSPLPRAQDAPLVDSARTGVPASLPAPQAPTPPQPTLTPNIDELVTILATDKPVGLAGAKREQPGLKLGENEIAPIPPPIPRPPVATTTFSQQPKKKTKTGRNVAIALGAAAALVIIGAGVWYAINQMPREIAANQTHPEKKHGTRPKNQQSKADVKPEKEKEKEKEKPQEPQPAAPATDTPAKDKPDDKLVPAASNTTDAKPPDKSPEPPPGTSESKQPADSHAPQDQPKANPPAQGSVATPESSDKPSDSAKHGVPGATPDPVPAPGTDTPPSGNKPDAANPSATSPGQGSATVTGAGPAQSKPAPILEFPLVFSGKQVAANANRVVFPNAGPPSSVRLIDSLKCTAGEQLGFSVSRDGESANWSIRYLAPSGKSVPEKGKSNATLVGTFQFEQSELKFAPSGERDPTSGSAEFTLLNNCVLDVETDSGPLRYQLREIKRPAPLDFEKLVPAGTWKQVNFPGSELANLPSGISPPEVVISIGESNLKPLQVTSNPGPGASQNRSLKFSLGTLENYLQFELIFKVKAEGAKVTVTPVMELAEWHAVLKRPNDYPLWINPKGEFTKKPPKPSWGAFDKLEGEIVAMVKKAKFDLAQKEAALEAEKKKPKEQKPDIQGKQNAVNNEKATVADREADLATIERAMKLMKQLNPKLQEKKQGQSRGAAKDQPKPPPTPAETQDAKPVEPVQLHFRVYYKLADDAELTLISTEKSKETNKEPGKDVGKEVRKEGVGDTPVTQKEHSGFGPPPGK